jgi:transglutaminase-like putative cysteine protease
LLLVPVATYTFPLRAGGSARSGDDSSWRPDTGTPPETDAQGLSGLAPPPADTPDRSLLRPAHLEIRPWAQGLRTGSVGALYLRGVPLVETGSDRWREDFAGLRACADADDGIADEWCRVRAQPAERDALVLEVTMVVPELASTGELVLLGPPAETAFEVPRMRAKRGGPYLVARPPTNAPFDYRVEAMLPWRIAPPAARVVARAPAKISADDESAASSVLAGEARRAAAGVGGDVERVRAVMRHLRSRFEYEELEDRREGPTSIAEFVAARRGTCIQFAKAGVVMLRHLGIASRVGTGFLVVEWDEGRGAYVVSGRDRHAWVEVEIEGSGWVVFDPTPAAPDAAKPSPDPMSPLAGPDPPPQELRPEEPPGDGESVSDSVRLAIEDVCRFLGELWRRAAEYWPVVAVAAFVAAALAAHSMLARRIRLAGAAPAVPAGRGPWESLVAELARRGHHRRLSQTASEFARAVAAAGGAPFAPFVPLTARREAARFGALDLTPADETAIDSFRASLPPR